MANLVGTLWKELVWVLFPNENGVYWELLSPLPIVVGLLSLRHILNRYCFVPLGQHLGVKDFKDTNGPPPNQILENLYKRFKDSSRIQILGAAKQVDLSERQVERWLRQRKKQDTASPLKKFCECCWRCAYYSSLFIYGVYILWKKPWFWDINKVWDGYSQSARPTSDVWWYYMVSLSFYWSLLIGQFTIDVKRKDFWPMFVHHLATIFLICFSWLAGAYKIGSLVLVVHDCGDIFIEAAKAAKYANFTATCTALFCAFAIVWMTTRMGIYPFWIIKHTLFGRTRYQENFQGYHIFNVLLILLFLLHCFWSYLILKAAASALSAGEMGGDVRSSSDENNSENSSDNFNDDR